MCVSGQTQTKRKGRSSFYVNMCYFHKSKTKQTNEKTYTETQRIKLLVCSFYNLLDYQLHYRQREMTVEDQLFTLMNLEDKVEVQRKKDKTKTSIPRVRQRYPTSRYRTSSE